MLHICTYALPAPTASGDPYISAIICGVYLKETFEIICYSLLFPHLPDSAGPIRMSLTELSHHVTKIVRCFLGVQTGRSGRSHLGTILLSAVSGIWRFCMVIRSLLPLSMETTHDPKEPVLLIALKIMRHAKLSFGDHVPYLRVLAPRKDVQGTVYLWAEGASLTC